LSIQPTLSEPVKLRKLRRSSSVKRAACSTSTGRMENAPSGQVALGQDLADQQRTYRRLVGRLENERATSGNGRRDLVGHQVVGEVERRDERHRPDRHTLVHAGVALGALGDIHRHDLATDARGFFGRDLEGLDQSGHFTAGIANDLAGLYDQRPRPVRRDVPEALDTMQQHVAFVPGRQISHGAPGRNGCCNRLIHHGIIGQRNAVGRLPGVLVQHLQILVGKYGPIGQVIGKGLGHGDHPGFQRMRPQQPECKA
jgi:hypothetical protein